MNIKPIGAQIGPEAPKAKRAEESTRSAGSDPARDRVELSEQARRLAGLTGASQQLPEIREERVAAAREAIESGTYHVDSRSLARAILEFEDDLSG